MGINSNNIKRQFRQIFSRVISGKKYQKKVGLLKKDGIKVKNGKINLDKYLHDFSS